MLGLSNTRASKFSCENTAGRRGFFCWLREENYTTDEIRWRLVQFFISETKLNSVSMFLCNQLHIFIWFYIYNSFLKIKSSYMMTSFGVRICSSHHIWWYWQFYCNVYIIIFDDTDLKFMYKFLQYIHKLSNNISKFSY